LKKTIHRASTAQTAIACHGISKHAFRIQQLFNDPIYTAWNGIYGNELMIPSL